VKATAYDNNVRKLSPFDQYRQWGWKALKLGNAGAAKLHAKKMIGLRPFDRRSWHLYAVALRGAVRLCRIRPKEISHRGTKNTEKEHGEAR
jgi:hypothetical protein